MKSIKKLAGAVMAMALAIGMMSCSSDSDSNDPVLPVTKKVATPTFSVADGTAVYSGISVTISCATEGATIYYTTDGNAPTTASTKYTAAISVTQPMTIKTIAVKNGMNNSTVASSNYTIKPDTDGGFVKINAGTFQMGSNAGEYSANKPVHNVTISKSFYICDHEVTQAEQVAVMGYHTSYFDGSSGREAATGEIQENRPAELSWYMAIVYCNTKSRNEGLNPCYTLNGSTNPSEWGPIPNSNDETWDAVTCEFSNNGFRLPTEAEWEYAARAGDTSVDAHTWSGTSDSSALGTYAWYSENSDNKTHEVKKKTPNAWKLYDMSGNVCEWCWDWWPETRTYSSEDVTDPTGVASGSRRICRGLAWKNAPEDCSVSFRGSLEPSYFWQVGGFRVVRTASAE